MRRTGTITRTFLGLAASLLAVSPFAVAQDSGPPADILGRYLIAWSEFQKPVPIPELPASQRDKQRHEIQPVSVVPPSLALVLTGAVAKEGDGYVLRVQGGTIYPIDDSEVTRAYEGRAIKITGVVDESTNTFRLLAVDLLP